MRTLLTLCLLVAVTANAADQFITPGDGELSWTVHQEYSDGSGIIGDQFNRLTFSSDPITGQAVRMTLEVRVTSVTDGVLFDTFTDVQLNGDIAITWRPALENPTNWFAGPFTSTVPASELMWSDHFAVKTTTVSLADPTVNSYAVWADWKKKQGTVAPRLTFGSQPPVFNHWLSNGLPNL